MPDTAAITDEIRRLITTDAIQPELIVVVAHLANMFPDMTIADLSAAMQEVAAEAERQATRRALRIILMSEEEVVLRMQSSGRWAVCRPGREPVEINSGELFLVEVDGVDELPTRMEHLWGEGYFSIDGYPLRDGIRAIGCGG